MKIICVIPARYNSSRLPGKPLLNINGKTMLQWVYSHCIEVKRFSTIIVATDDERISNLCKKENMNYIMTRNDHPNHISRIHEVSDKIQGDLFVSINGDEPLLTPFEIESALPEEMIIPKIFYFGAYRKLKDDKEIKDSSNIKIVLNKDNRCIYMSRFPIPFPKGITGTDYKKYIGIECFSKNALDYFVNTPPGILEKIEDIDHLRFIENGKEMIFSEIESDSISVDTQYDLEKVRTMMNDRIDQHQHNLIK